MTSMETRTLTHTDLTVSRAAFGAMPFGSQTDEAEARRMIDCCLDRGVNFFDTAKAYNHGLSESILGKLLKGRRDKVVLATKVRAEVPGDGGLTRAAILRAIDESLARLQTDYVDVYYFHAPDWDVPIEESLEAMDQLVRAGKVRYPATSNYAAWQIAEMFGICEKRGYKPPTISQPMYNVLARGIEQEYLAMCRRFGVSNVVYNPLAGGLLTGKQPPAAPIAGTRFDNNQQYLDRYWHPAYFDAVQQLRAAAERAGRSLIDISLSWLLRHTPTDCVILGATKVTQLEQNLTAVENSAPLSPELLDAIDQVWRKLRGVTPQYNR